MTQLTIRSTISADTRTLLMELLGNAQQAVRDDILEDVADVKILAAHLNAIVEALEGDKVCEPQVNSLLCSVLQTMPMAYKFDWQSILQDPDLNPQDNLEAEAEAMAEVLEAIKPRMRKRKSA